MNSIIRGPQSVSRPAVAMPNSVCDPTGGRSEANASQSAVEAERVKSASDLSPSSTLAAPSAMRSVKAWSSERRTMVRSQNRKRGLSAGLAWAMASSGLKFMCVRSPSRPAAGR